MHLPLLSILTWLPVLGGIAVMLIGDTRASLARWVALVVSLVALAVSVPLWNHFDATSAALQFVERMPWVPSLNSDYYLGIDGISLPLIVLTTFSTVLVLVAGWTVIDKRPSQYYAAFLIMEGLMVGVFSAADALLFYVFWEAMLIPMFLIIGIWGGARRIYATIKFFLYTFLGSVFMLVALIYMYLKSGSYDLASLYQLPLSRPEQTLIFLAFFAAFAVKVPMVPVHTWLPDAHVEAPTGGSVILAAIMLKMGGYGFLRFSLPIAPDAAHALDWLVIGLSLVAVAYIGLVALVQTDMKKLIAYSSIAHMAFVTLGCFVGYEIVTATGSAAGATLALSGAMVQMISHGLVSGALFLCVGVMYDRVHSRLIADYGGVANRMPVFAALMMLFAMANAGLPGTSGFVGEWLVILATMKVSFWYAALAATTLIFGAAYTLWMYKRVIFGEVANHHVAELTDANGREIFILGVLAIAVLGMGLWPAPMGDVLQQSINEILRLAAPGRKLLIGM